MSNFKVTEDFLINVIQTHDFKSYIREHIVKVHNVMDDIERTDEELVETKNSLIKSLGDERYNEIKNGKIKNEMDNLLYTDYIVNKSKESIKTVWNVFLEKNIRNLVMTEKCMELISTMKLDKSFRYDFLRTLPNRTDLISLNKDECVMYKKTESRVIVIWCKSSNKKINEGIDITVSKKFLDIDLVNNSHYSSNITDWNDTSKELELSIYSRFVQIVSFIELGNTNFKIVPPKNKVGNFLKNNECKNQTKKSFIVVDTDWNDISIRMEGFPVKGHLRLQRCGVGRGEFKVIYIQPFMKNGYNRNHLKNGVNIENIEFEEVEKV